MRIYFISFLFLLCNFSFFAQSKLIVGKNQPYKTLKSALAKAQNGDTILVKKGIYKEGNIEVKKE